MSNVYVNQVVKSYKIAFSFYMNLCYNRLYFQEREMSMGHKNTKKMVQGAMIAALFGVLSLINTYTGSLFDIFICYGMVPPLVWYGYHYDLKSNIVVCVVSMFVIMMVGLPFFIVSSVASCLAGLWIGECLKRHAQKGMIILGAFGVTLINNICIYEVFSGLLGINISQEMIVMYEELSQIIPAIAQNINVNMFLSMIPMVLIIMSVMEMYVIVLLCQLVLTRLKVEFPGNFHIATMHLSQKQGLIVAGVMFGGYILYNFVHIDSIYLVYAYTLGMFVFLLQGLSFMSFYLIIKQKPKWLIFAFVAMFIPMVSMVYVVVGILDIFSDLRRNILYNINNGV